MSRAEENVFGAEAKGSNDRPAWQRQASQNYDEAAGTVAQFYDAWNKWFGAGAPDNPEFMRNVADAVMARGGVALFELVYRRCAGTQAMTGTPFPARYEESAKALGAGTPPTGGPVPIGVLFYLNEALEQAREQKQSEETFPDLEPVDRLVALGNQLLEDERLSGFRCDVLQTLPPHLNSPAAARIPIELESFVGKVFRGYKILEPLGRGGYGAVFLAEHPTLPVKRALKIFLDVDRTGPGFEKFREKCLAEAKIQSALKHENIVEIVDVFEDQGYVILVMEYVQGRNLAHLINEKNGQGVNLPPLELLDLAIPVTRGLSHAHRRGIVHRDIKPENILLSRVDNEVPKIADFGLARDLEESGQRHRTVGYLVGTPVYMAPEQIARKAKTYDHRCDIYSLGIVLYEMALGTAPFVHEDNFKILEKHEKEAPDPLSLRIQDFPDELDRIILKCLEKRPEDRFATAEQLLSALVDCRGHLAAGVSPSVRPAWDTRPTANRRRGLVFAAAAAVLAIATAMAYPSFAGWIWRPAAPSGEIGKSTDRSPASADKDAPRPEPRESRPPIDSPVAIDKGEKVRGDAGKDVLPARESGDPRPAVPEPRIPIPPLREQLAGYPVESDDALLLSQLVDLFGKYRADLLARRYEGIQKDLASIGPAKKSEYASYHIDAAKEIVRLGCDLVKDRWRELAESKTSLRIMLVDGRTAEGMVNRVEERSLTLEDPKGSQTGVEIANVALEEFLRGRTVAAAEVAYQAMSGDAAKALALATDLEKSKERVVLWYPFLVRLARLQHREQLRDALSVAEAKLARGEKRATFLGAITRYSEALATLQSMADAETSIASLYPSLAREFAEARREGAAADSLLSGAYSRVLGRFGGTEACRAAATLLLAGFLADLDRGHNDLIAKGGWLNYDWQLRPDEASLKERTQYWDVLEDDGCVLRDSKGPRRLIMGRPHPRASEGLVIRFEFESLGEERASAEWGLALRREGGGNSYLRFGKDGISLHPFTLEGGTTGEPLAPGAAIRVETEPKTHTCVLLPGDFLHVFVDGQIVANFAKDDALLPSQPSVSVVHGKLSLRSIWVNKKPGK